MTELSPATTEVKDMFGSIARRYDLTNTVLSFGTHHYWKRKLVSLLPQAEDKAVLDLCTGTGDLLPLLKRRFGSAVGADFCEPMLLAGREKFGDKFEFIQADAHELPFADDSFDVVTVSFGVRNFRDLMQGLKEIYRVLKVGGSLLVLEFGQPRGLIFGPIYKLYSRYVIPLIGGLLTGNSQAYRYLPETSKNFPCDASFVQILKEVGFKNVKSQPLTGGIAYTYIGTKLTEVHSA